MRALLLLLALALALVLALAATACGGGGDDGDAGDAPPAENGEAAGDGDEGRQLFVANCGSCHVLSDAGTTGTTGPSFDDFAPAQESVEAQVRSGGGGMPSFEGTLTDEQIQTVSAYVAEHAGGG